MERKNSKLQNKNGFSGIGKVSMIKFNEKVSMFFIQEDEIPIEDSDLYDEEKEIYHGENEDEEPQEKDFDRDEFQE